jgi:hypothetical protein
MKKGKNPLDLGSDKKYSELIATVSKSKNITPSGEKLFSSTVTQKKVLNLGLKLNKNLNKADSLYEGPHTNRYEYSDTHQDQFFNLGGPDARQKNLISNYDDQHDRNKHFLIQKGDSGFSSTNCFKASETNSHNTSTNINFLNSNNKLESYTKKFGQILQKGEKQFK